MRKKIETVNCKWCGGTFTPKPFHGKRQQFCSIDCRWNYERANPKKISVVCKNCAKKFDVYHSRLKHGNPLYCSVECYESSGHKSKVNNQIKRVPRVKSICKTCGKVFSHRITEPRVYCSQSCANNILKHTNPRYRRLRTPSWEKMRKTIIERDGRKCQICGSRKSLVVHHIQPWVKVREDNPKNLITLCRSCHFKVEHSNHPCPAPLF